MHQWHDDTLVAIQGLSNGKFKVVELPARQTSIITSRQTFSSRERAERYINDQYLPQAIVVEDQDLQEEVRLRLDERQRGRL